MEIDLDGILEKFWDAPVTEETVRMLVANIDTNWLVDDDEFAWRKDQPVDFYKGMVATMRFIDLLFQGNYHPTTSRRVIGIFITSVLNVLKEKMDEEKNTPSK